MCLGIPARIVELLDNPYLATADVLGDKTTINIGMLEEPPEPGDYVLIHVGFAMEQDRRRRRPPGAGRPAAHGKQRLGG